MANTYRVIFNGDVVKGRNPDEVKKSLRQILNIDITQIERLFSGEKMVIKKDVDLNTCEKVAARFKQAGAKCEIEKEDEAVLSDLNNQPPPLPAASGPESSITPNQGTFRQADEKFCESCGRTIKLNALTCRYCGKNQVKKGMGCLPKAAIAIGISFFILPVIGILAAIAIPNFIAYRTKAIEAGVRSDLSILIEKEELYYTDYQRYTQDIDELDFVPSTPDVVIEIISADANCYRAKGVHESRDITIWTDCSGTMNKEEN